MADQNLADLIDTLTPEQQESVRQFVDFLKQRESTRTPFLTAVDEFVDQHPESLRRLAE